jgi:hypothetical protein
LCVIPNPSTSLRACPEQHEGAGSVRDLKLLGSEIPSHSAQGRLFAEFILSVAKGSG